MPFVICLLVGLAFLLLLCVCLSCEKLEIRNYDRKAKLKSFCIYSLTLSLSNQEFVKHFFLLPKLIDFPHKKKDIILKKKRSENI